jgi:hypothetical protein
VREMSAKCVMTLAMIINEGGVGGGKKQSSVEEPVVFI